MANASSFELRVTPYSDKPFVFSLELGLIVKKLTGIPGEIPKVAGKDGWTAESTQYVDQIIER